MSTFSVRHQPALEGLGLAAHIEASVLDGVFDEAGKKARVREAQRNKISLARLAWQC